MKIAIPTANGNMCMHFGHCEQFAIVDVDEVSKTINSTEMLTPPPHEPGVLPQWIADNGVTLVIAGGMGQRAQTLFAQKDIETIPGVTGGTPEEIVTAWLNDNLETGQNACDH